MLMMYLINQPLKIFGGKITGTTKESSKLKKNSQRDLIQLFSMVLKTVVMEDLMLDSKEEACQISYL